MEKREYIEKWISLASGDFKVALREFGNDDAVLEAVCFHLQQAVEKILKAYLINEDIAFPKTHNLSLLLHLCSERDSCFRIYEEELALLDDCGVFVRYPDYFETLTRKELEDIIVQVESFWKLAFGKLGDLNN
jgi:HEPN domain-containing protein